MDLLTFLVGLFMGGLIGFFGASLLVAARRGDDMPANKQPPLPNVEPPEDEGIQLVIYARRMPDTMSAPDGPGSSSSERPN